MIESPLSPGMESYDPQFFSKIAAVEDEHFWFAARNRSIAAAVDSIVSDLPKGYRVLEVGCGTGIVLRRLVEVCRQGHVVGMDLYPEAVAFANRRASCEVVVGDIYNPPPFGRFEVVTIFDVLEHLPDDGQAVAALNALINPGGYLVLTVPAHMSLWSYFDVAACHCRRYNRQKLTKILEEGGFKISYLTEFMTILYPLIWLLRRLRRGASNEDRQVVADRAASELQVVPGLNAVMKMLLSWEPLAMERRWSLPIGTSLLAIARKK